MSQPLIPSSSLGRRSHRSQHSHRSTSNAHDEGVGGSGVFRPSSSTSSSRRRSHLAHQAGKTPDMGQSGVFLLSKNARPPSRGLPAPSPSPARRLFEGSSTSRSLADGDHLSHTREYGRECEEGSGRGLEEKVWRARQTLPRHTPAGGSTGVKTKKPHTPHYPLPSPSVSNPGTSLLPPRPASSASARVVRALKSRPPVMDSTAPLSSASSMRKHHDDVKESIRSRLSIPVEKVEGHELEDGRGHQHGEGDTAGRVLNADLDVDIETDMLKRDKVSVRSYSSRPSVRDEEQEEEEEDGGRSLVSSSTVASSMISASTHHRTVDELIQTLEKERELRQDSEEALSEIQKRQKKILSCLTPDEIREYEREAYTTELEHRLESTQKELTIMRKMMEGMNERIDSAVGRSSSGSHRSAGERRGAISGKETEEKGEKEKKMINDPYEFLSFGPRRPRSRTKYATDYRGVLVPQDMPP